MLQPRGDNCSQQTVCVGGALVALSVNVWNKGAAFHRNKLPGTTRGVCLSVACSAIRTKPSRHKPERLTYRRHQSMKDLKISAAVAKYIVRSTQGTPNKPMPDRNTA